MKRIGIMTGTRAEYGGLPSAKLFTELDKLEIGDTFEITILDETHVYKVDKISIVKPNDRNELKINKDNDLELYLIVSGMHLSPEFGMTYQEIEEDGFEINAKVEMLLSSDSPAGISKSIGLGVIGFADEFQRADLDMLILLGDRYEALSAAICAMVMRIPIAHLHGGELTEGAIDEGIRHSITKMSYLHFTSTEQYRNRVIQLGENPERVFYVGALGVENIKKINLMTKEELERSTVLKSLKGIGQKS